MSIDTLSATISPISTAFNAAKAAYSGIQSSITLAETLGGLPAAFQ
ncbi:MAG: hypothetical protein L0H59_10590 [Tomitella sp.]|nr:hypothetical protein [Tomitella sp.]